MGGAHRLHKPLNTAPVRKPTLLSRIVRRIILAIWYARGWRIDSPLPKHLKKYVLAGAPHTSNWDFVFFTGATHEEGVKPLLGHRPWPPGQERTDLNPMPRQAARLQEGPGHDSHQRHFLQAREGFAAGQGRDNRQRCALADRGGSDRRRRRARVGRGPRPARGGAAAPAVPPPAG